MKKHARVLAAPLLALLPLLLAALAFPLAASGLFDAKLKPADWDRAKTGARVELSGIVRVVGNEPFTETVITDSDGHDWFVDSSSAGLLKGMEHKPVTVTGTVERKPMILANGKKLGDRRVLRDLTVLN